MRVVSMIKMSSLVCVASVGLSLACNSNGAQMTGATTTAGAPSTAAPSAPVAGAAAPTAAAGSSAPAAAGTAAPAAAAGSSAPAAAGTAAPAAAAGSSAPTAAAGTAAPAAAAGSSAPAAGSGAPAAGGGMGWNDVYDSVIVDSGCVGGGACHQSSAGNSKLGLADPMMAYTELLNVAAMGMNLPGGMMTAPNCAGTGTLRVKPGDPDNSLLVQKLEGKQKCGISMPPGGPLDAAKIMAVRAWIMAGAKP